MTTGFYDINRYEPIDIVQGISVHAISFFRGLFSSITGLAGGRQQAIEDKYIDVRNEALNEMVERAKQMGGDAVVGVEVETTEMGQSYVVFIAAGTVLRLKKKGGYRIVQKSKKSVSKKNVNKKLNKKSKVEK